MAGLLLFIAATLLIANAETALIVQALRAVQGLGGGFASVIGMAMIHHAYPATEAAKRFPVVMTVMLWAPLIAPAMGALVLDLGGRRPVARLGGAGALLLDLGGPAPYCSTWGGRRRTARQRHRSDHSRTGGVRTLKDLAAKTEFAHPVGKLSRSRLVSPAASSRRIP